MSQTRLTQLTITRIAAFAVIYTILGLLVPIQGYVTVGFAVGTVIVAILYGLVLYYLNVNMPLGRKARILITWSGVYIIQLLNPVLEGFFFTTQFEGQPELVFGAVIFGLVLTLPTAVAAGFLFIPEGEIRSFSELRKEYSFNWTLSQYAVRIIIASMLWLGIYFTIGSIIAPLVLPYYIGGSVGYELALPAVEIVIFLQTVRGFIYTLGFLPIIISVNLNRKSLAIITVGLLYIAGALAVFVISDQFPIFLRLIHGLELFVDSFIAGIVFAFALGRQSHPLDESAPLTAKVEIPEQIA